MRPKNVEHAFEILKEIQRKMKKFIASYSLPTFDGIHCTDAAAWYDCILKYKQEMTITDEEIMEEISLHLDGTAKVWFRRYEDLTWMQFSNHFRQKYKDFKDIKESMKKIETMKHPGIYDYFKTVFKKLKSYQSSLTKKEIIELALAHCDKKFLEFLVSPRIPNHMTLILDFAKEYDRRKRRKRKTESLASGQDDLSKRPNCSEVDKTITKEENTGDEKNGTAVSTRKRKHQDSTDDDEPGNCKKMKVTSAEDVPVVVKIDTQEL